MFSRPSSPSSGDNWCERRGAGDEESGTTIGREGGREGEPIRRERAARSEARTYARLRANSTRLVKFREISAIPRSRLAPLRAPGCKEQGVTFESRVYAATRPGRGDGGGGGLRGRRERDTTLSCVKLGDRVGRSLIVPASELLSHVHTHRLTHTHSHTHTFSFSLFLSEKPHLPALPTVQVAANSLSKPTRHHSHTRAHRQTHTRARPISLISPCPLGTESIYIYTHTNTHTRARVNNNIRPSCKKKVVLLSDYDCLLPTAVVRVALLPSLQLSTSVPT